MTADILYLSHCVPNPPDKGEKIRAYHLVRQLGRRFRVHVAAFARTAEDVAAAEAMKGECASIHVVHLASRWALAKAALRFAGAGESLAMSFYRNAVMTAYCRSLADRVPLAATVAFSTPMAQYAPDGVPLILDMTDVDSEKWFQYARLRFPGPLYGIEGRRLRAAEIHHAGRAQTTFLATQPETRLLTTFAPGVHAATLENGVDLDYFHPAAASAQPPNAPYALFVGAMDYYPNADAVTWFARHVTPLIARTHRFVIAGRNPGRAVRALASDNITVTGSIPDVRPYLGAAAAVVAPLRLARGIQNKVLEALAMGKTVLASTDICRTFGDRLPEGVLRCETPEDYARHLRTAVPYRQGIRAAAAARFQWAANVDTAFAAWEVLNGGRRAALPSDERRAV